MKHKQDAIDNANELIGQFTGIGIGKKKARKAALITIQHIKSNCAPFAESSVQRTKNYLLCLVFGDETARKIHDLEQERRAIGNKIGHAEPADYKKLDKRRKDINKELSEFELS